MSAYVVEDRTIDRIISGLASFGFMDEVLYECETDSADELGASLLEMNCDAFDERYDDKADREFLRSYKYKPVPVSKMQLLKSLACYLYQCAEGHVPERSLYQTLYRIKGELAYDIISDSREYDVCEWA